MEPEQQCVSSACTKILRGSCKDSSFVWSSKGLLDEPADEQKHNLQAFLAGRVAFVWFTTGSGKSLWYAALPSAFGYKWFKSKENLQGQILSSCILVVVFPLTALTVDQVAMLKNRGLKSAFVGGKQTDESIQQQLEKWVFTFVLMSPESLLKVFCWREILRSRLYQDYICWPPQVH